MLRAAGTVAVVNTLAVLGSIDLDGDTVPNSCIDLPDGQHYVKLLEGDDYPLVSVTCSNGYMLIDYNSDNDWSNYFTSFLKWHYAIGGPSHNDHVNWAEWYLPDDSNTNYIISPSCDVCDETSQSDLRNTKELQSGYYMNANLFGCFVYPRGMPNCDFDLNTYECKACYTENFNVMYTVDFDDEEMTDMGACMTWIRGAYDEVDRTFDECTDATDNGFKPTIGLKGEFCVCAKPSASQYFELTQEMIQSKEESLKNQETERTESIAAAVELAAKTADDKTVYLSKADFADGTLRIREPGTYILTEDIEFNWNAGSKDEPNAEGAWFPMENDEKYPGYGTSRDPFFMGFFAGITIECDNVVLDLNGHELKQSKEFFYQQGFFSTIEVENQPFIPGQGVGFFGSDPFFPANVVIKNGNLGRTSHHCIHGNNNKNLLIENVNCYDFSTHGIQLNGFDGITLRNVDIGPSNTEQFLASEYTHYRFLLPRLRKIAESNPTGTIQFANREKAVTMADIADELERKMTYAYKYVMYNEEYTEEDEEYEEFSEAMKIFINENGLGYGASQYGLFLSYPGANVLSYHLNAATANDATLENVNIHDLHHQTKEYVGIRTTLRLFVNSFNAPLHLQYLLGDELFAEIEEAGPKSSFDASYEYVGNILTDATLAMSELNKDEWGWNQIMYVLSDELTAWAKGEIDGTFNGNKAMFLCAIDGMIHAAKGTFGLRIDGVDDVKIDGLKVSNIQEDSPLGYGICGQCTQCAFESRSPYQVHYTGNMVQGISIDYATPLAMKDVTIDGVYSETGKAYGIALWPGVAAEFKGDISVNNVAAGRNINYKNLKSWEHSVALPDACGIHVYDEEMGYNANDNDNDISTVTFDESNTNVVSQCIVGKKGCFYDNDIYAMVGETLSCNSEEDEDEEESVVVKSKTLKQHNMENDMNKAEGSVGKQHHKHDVSTDLVYYAIVGLLIALFVYYMYQRKRKVDNNEESSGREFVAVSGATEQSPLIA